MKSGDFLPKNTDHQHIDKFFFFLVTVETFSLKHLNLLPSFPQLTLRMSKLPMAGRWAGPSSLRHGDRLPQPSRSPRSATGCSRAPWGGPSAQRMSCRQRRVLRRRAPLSRCRLPVLLQTQEDSKEELRHGRHACTCLRSARLVKKP